LKEVEKKLEVAVKSSPDPLAEAFYKRGLDYFSKGDYKNAEIFFSRALKVDPNHEKAREALERVRRALGK
jgi:tetratricopeptide (TPR) repeat protein